MRTNSENTPDQLQQLLWGIVWALLGLASAISLIPVAVIIWLAGKLFGWW